MPEGRYPTRAGYQIDISFEVTGHTLSLPKLSDENVRWNPMRETGQRGGVFFSKVAQGIAYLVEKGMPMLDIVYGWTNPAFIRLRKPTLLAPSSLSSTPLVFSPNCSWIHLPAPTRTRMAHAQGRGLRLEAGRRTPKQQQGATSSLSLVLHL